MTLLTKYLESGFKICTFLFFLGEFVHARSDTFHILDLSKSLPEWSYYSLQGVGNTKLFITKENELNAHKDITCNSLKKLRIETLKILKEDIYLKGQFHFKSLLHTNCSLSHDLEARRFNLYLPLLSKTIIIDIHEIFPREFSLTSIVCRGVPPSLVMINSKGLLKCDRNIIRASLNNEKLKCLVFAKNHSYVLKRVLFIEFSHITQILKRKRRSIPIVFEKDPFFAKVKENAKIGTIILILKAVGGSGTYRYTKNRDQKTDRLFSLEQTTGELKVQENLNRETDAIRFTIDITATDVDDSTSVARTSVEIEVVDINDNSPIFEKPGYAISIKEEQSPRFIISVVATDADSDENAQIDYCIVKNPSNVNFPFKIDKTTGVISNTELLDREVQPYYVLQVKAQDRGVDPGPLSTTVLVNITLIDINDNPPIFTKEKYAITIPETTKAGVVILSVKATDKDIGSNGYITYQLIDDAFNINRLTGEISLTRQLDYESYERFFSFSITAFDRGSPPEFATAKAEITVEDVNDNKPLFTRKDFRSSRPIYEDSKIGEVVFKLSARDLDSGDNKLIKYSLANNIPSNFPFGLNEDTGEITIVKSLDYEMQQEYHFGVIATDGGKPPLSDTATVTLEIGNINDNPPMFSNSTYYLEISEDTAKGAPIIKVKATDPDHLSSGESFEYAIDEGDSSGCFSIDTYSGTILLRNCELDVKKTAEYKLKLSVTDEDDKKGYAWLIITVLDANNNAPKFSRNVNTLTVMEDALIGTSVGMVIATDDDSGENARITYSMLQPDDTFSLNSTTGDITIKQKLDREKKVSYQFLIKAQDHGKPVSKSSTTTVVVKVLDVNDEAPVFIQDSYSFNVREDISLGSIVGKVSAVDADEGSNKEVRYKLFNDGEGSFVIGYDNGLIRTSKALDREKISSYKLVVTAIDQGFQVQLNSSVNVHIVIEDVADSAPKFERATYQFFINEGEIVLVGKVRANLNDSEQYQRDLIYTIKENAPNNPFTMDRRDGSIMTAYPLDFEAHQNYTIVVRVKAPSQISDLAVVNIYVQDKNDNPPELKDFYIFLNVLGGKFNPIFKVPAEDKDATSRLKYYILQGNERDYVTLNENTGELTLMKSILNTQDEAEIRFEVTDGENSVQAVGRIAVSEVTSEMVENSMFIILNNATRDMFLRSEVLTKFKNVLAETFSCDSRRIFILSIRNFEDVLEKNSIPKLEVAIAVRERNTERFLPSDVLKDLLYLNRKAFENNLKINIISFDYWSDFFCALEPCKNFEQCRVSIISNNSQSQEDTIASKYVIFRGVDIQQQYTCSCPHGYANGPKQNDVCSEWFSLCYSKPCGTNGTCISIDGEISCVCDPEYAGDHCEIHKETSTCPGTTPISLTTNPCKHGGKCIPKEEGFQCQCAGKIQTDADLCTLSARHFEKGSYFSVEGLKKQWNVTITLEFSTYESNGVLMYNGRYTNDTDFLSILIVNGQIEFVVSLGLGKTRKIIEHRAKSFIAGGVNDGRWQTVKVHYNNEMLKIAVGDKCDLQTANMLNPEGKFSYCSSSKVIEDEMRSLDLTAPLHIGGLPDIGRAYNVHASDFIGCIRNITIDHKKVDLANAIQSHNTTTNCPLTTDYCSSQNPCRNNGGCVSALGEAICVCPIGWIGKHCELDVSVSSPSIKLLANNKVVFDRINKVSSANFWSVSLVVKTTKLNALVFEDEMDGKIGFLKLSNGYPYYVFDSTVILNLTSLYLSNGKWHHIELKQQDNWLFLSANYGRLIVKKAFPYTFISSYLTKIGGNGDDEFIGCMKGFNVNGKDISLSSTRNQNVEKGCSESGVCTTDIKNTCGMFGECEPVYGASECVCKKGYLGPQCIDICAGKPCFNGGLCKYVDVAVKPSGFQCSCKGNFTGELCETEIKSECEDGYYKFEGGTCGPCTCKTNENYNATCDKDGRLPDSFPGKCFCKDEFYLKDGSCIPCDCLTEGLFNPLNHRCNKVTGQCMCKSNLVGRKCDQCQGVWQEVTNNCMEINTSCPESYVEGIKWRRVHPGVTGVESCPAGAFGNATRFCHVRNSWMSPNLFGCISTEFYNLNSEMKHIITTKKWITQTDAKDLATRLYTATEVTKRLYGKDIEIGYQALEMLIEYEGNQTGSDLVSSEDSQFVANIIRSTSTLFQLDLQTFWVMIQEKYAGSAGVMRVMETFVEILTLNLPYVKRSGIRLRRSLPTLIPYTFAAESIYLEIQPVILNRNDSTFELPQKQLEWARVYRTWSFPNIAVSVPSRMFKNDIRESSNDAGIGIVVYKTLGGLLPPVYDAKDRQKGRSYTIDVYSDVFSLTIPKNYIYVSKYSTAEIKIVYKHVKANTTEISLTCAFWNYSLSDTISGGWSRSGCRTVLDNTTDVTCYCNHLTSFALIGVRYTEVMPRVYTPAIITYLAVAVAILLMFVVFLVYFCLRQLKSNANSIHKNLAFVGILSWLVFITLINRPGFGENFCRLIAIVLHYFITCIFSWMFVEALHMYRMILEPRDINYGQMMFYYFIGWGAPLMVVGVTAGLKPEGYGGKEFCWISIFNFNEIMWVYLAPILAIIATNLMLIFAAFSSSCQHSVSKKKKAKVAIIRYRLAISMVYLPLLGATVVGALITVNYDDELYAYVFPGVCVLQAVYLLICYVFFNRKVRREAKNAYIRWKTGDKTYGIKVKRKPRPLLNPRVKERYRPMLQAFHIPTSSTSDSSDTTDGRRRARIRMGGSDTTDFATTNFDSSDSSDDDSISARKPTIDSDSDSSENSFGGDQSQTSNGFLGHTPQRIEWKEATQKKLITKRTYASDGPMHSTPSESQSDTSGRKLPRNGFGNSELTAIPSESEDGMRFATRPGPRVNVKTQSTSSNTDSDAESKRKTPVSILKKKSSYENGGRGKVVKVKKREGSKKLLMGVDDTTDLNDSQV